MIKILKYADRIIEIKPYDIKTERDLLLFGGSLDNILTILRDNIKSNIDISELSTREKIAIVYAIRAISVGEDLELTITCPSCRKKFDKTIDISELITNGTLSEEYKDVISDDISDFIGLDANELDIITFDKLEEFINNNKTKINLRQEICCSYCKSKSIIELSDESLLAKSLSEDNITTFYESLNKLVYAGKYDLNGLMNSYPFERAIYIGLVSKEIEEKNKQIQQQNARRNSRY